MNKQRNEAREEKGENGGTKNLKEKAREVYDANNNNSNTPQGKGGRERGGERSSNRAVP